MPKIQFTPKNELAPKEVTVQIKTAVYNAIQTKAAELGGETKVEDLIAQAVEQVFVSAKTREPKTEKPSKRGRQVKPISDAAA